MSLAMVTLQLGDYAVIGAMLSFTTGLLVFYMRSVTKRLETVETQVSELQSSKVSHRDWVRVVASQLNRQDRMSEQLAELTGKIDATMGITGSIKRIADKLQDRHDG